MRLIHIGVVPLILAILLTRASSCGNGEEEATPEPGLTSLPEVTPSAIELLEDSAASASEAISHRWQLEAIEIMDGDEATALITGEATLDAFHVKSVASDGTDYEIIYVGDKQYVRMGDGSWPMSDFPTQYWAGSVSSGILRQLDALVDVKVVGEEEVNGALMVHVGGRTDMAAKVKQIWPDYDTANPQTLQRQFLAGTEHVDCWLGEEDKMLRKMRVRTALPAVVDLGAYADDATFSYWGYNTEIVIEAPVLP